jgi:hypothetical protein
MDLYTTFQGEQILMQAACSPNGQIGFSTAHLYTNNVPYARSTGLTAFEEAGFPGYRPQVLPATISVTPGADGTPTFNFPTATFTMPPGVLQVDTISLPQGVVSAPVGEWTVYGTPFGQYGLSSSFLWGQFTVAAAAQTLAATLNGNSQFAEVATAVASGASVIITHNLFGNNDPSFKLWVSWNEFGLFPGVVSSVNTTPGRPPVQVGESFTGVFLTDNASGQVIGYAPFQALTPAPFPGQSVVANLTIPWGC